MNAGMLYTKKMWNYREREIPLREDVCGNKFHKILFVGATGVGKTSLVRQVLGTEKFPSTSSSRTTICNFEALLDNSSYYKATITYFSYEYVLGCVSDCLFDACDYFIFNNGNYSRVWNKFTEHRDQKFHLKYILGNPNSSSVSKKIEKRFGIYKKCILSVADCYTKKVRDILNDDEEIKGLSEEDKNVCRKLYKDAVCDCDEFKDAVDVIINDIKSVWEDAVKGMDTLEEDGWPYCSSFKTDDRDFFLSKISLFSSNEFQKYGILATPLVEGMRVSGPFVPSCATSCGPNIVVIDGVGVGHNMDVEGEPVVSSHTVDLFFNVDEIYIVDKANDPFKSETCSIVKSAMTNGVSAKMHFLFTHFDLIKGDNYESDDDKIDTIQDSCRQLAGKLDNLLGGQAKGRLESLALENSFYLSNVQEFENEPSVNDGLRRFVSRLGFDVSGGAKQFSKDNPISKAVVPPKASSKKKEFDHEDLLSNGNVQNCLEEAIEYGVNYFYEKWKALLNYESNLPFSSVHWTRIKALSRRLGRFQMERYQELCPSRDLREAIQEKFYSLIQLQKNLIDNEIQDDVLQKCGFEINRCCRIEITDSKRNDWNEAYEFRGEGSTFERREKIKEIYKTGAKKENLLFWNKDVKKRLDNFF